ncbi:hypothetical protein GCM10010435_75570 [Winogradskya consettensis]|uniref:Uncharacterized protein n=1 Tax=Winogradskya consettensis TaxID=113560 RepID=A0A919VVX7_9ACTN|nr:hypothetical protein [Actinoplanes consettensis]GIM81196.1 hypothetical protein Aco04nite_75350 [Actinoplanes consettensis]
MTSNDGSETAPRWFGVRCVYHDAVRNAYEERVTVWQADSVEASIALAEAEAGEYSAGIDFSYLGLAQAYLLVEPPGHGADVFSLIRRSDLDPHAYVTSFFDTGHEITGEIS